MLLILILVAVEEMLALKWLDSVRVLSENRHKQHAILSYCWGASPRLECELRLVTISMCNEMLELNQFVLSWDEGAWQAQVELGLWNGEGWRDKEIEGNIPSRQSEGAKSNAEREHVAENQLSACDSLLPTTFNHGGFTKSKRTSFLVPSKKQF